MEPILLPSTVTAYPPIEELMLHRDQMLLAERVVDYSADCIVCAVRISPESAFVDHGRVDAVVALEYMAQTIAAYVGLQRRTQQLSPKIGYLISARELSLEVDSFSVGSELVVEATRLWGEKELGHFRCTVKQGHDTLATGQLSVYQPPDPHDDDTW